MYNKIILSTLMMSMSSLSALAMEVKEQDLTSNSNRTATINLEKSGTGQVTSVPEFGKLHTIYYDYNNIDADFDNFADKYFEINKKYKGHEDKYRQLSTEIKDEFVQFRNHYDAHALDLDSILTLGLEEEYQARNALLDMFRQKMEKLREETKPFLKIMHEKTRLPAKENFFLCFDEKLNHVMKEGIPAKTFDMINTFALGRDTVIKNSMQMMLHYAPGLNEAQKEAINNYFHTERNALFEFHQAYLKRLKDFREKVKNVVLNYQ